MPMRTNKAIKARKRKRRTPNDKPDGFQLYRRGGRGRGRVHGAKG